MKSKIVLTSLIWLNMIMVNGQLDSTIYGITRDFITQELYLSNINPLSGEVAIISSASLSSTYVLDALATIDPIGELFYLHSQDTLFGIDLNSGNVVHKSHVTTPFTGYFDLMKFNCSDSTIYGITRASSTQALYLSKVDPLTGVVTNISSASFSSTYVLNALATIDPINELFYLNSQDTLFGIDLNTGNVVHNSYVTPPISGYFDLMNFNCSDSTIYGITRDGSTQGLFLSKVNPLTGVVTIISSEAFSSTYVLNSLATIDPINELFYLHSQDTLFGIDLNTGNVVSNSFVSTPIEGIFDLMNFRPNICDDEFVGIELFTPESESVIFYPNPTNDLLNIKCTTYDFTVDIYSITGKLVKSARSNDSLSLTLEMDGISHGLYTLIVYNDKGIVGIKKIVKN